MKIYTSYFYQLRFFTPNMIPVSTAVWDPKWYHDFKGQGYVFVDKRGVVNGLRAEALHPAKDLDGECHGREGCTQQPSSCRFLKAYREQLSRIDTLECVRRLYKLGQKLKSVIQFDGDPVIVLMVHEARTNPCSERGPLQDWLNSYGFKCEEWKGAL